MEWTWQSLYERTDRNLNVPNLYVNDNGKLNVSNSNVVNDNDGRVSARLVRINFMLRFYANRQFDGGPLLV